MDSKIIIMTNGLRFKERLRGRLPEDLLRLVPEKIRVVGNVAIVSLSPELAGFGQEIGCAILNDYKRVKTVLNRVSKTHGNVRVADYEILAGCDTVTVHKEWGHSYELDLIRVFFNPHLGYERNRVASLTKAGETVFVPFCGVGPFVIPVAAKGAKVVGIEISGEACKWHVLNLRRNKVRGNVIVINGDAFNLPIRTSFLFDRAIVPTPYGMDRILSRVSPTVKPGGMIHFYTFKKSYQINGLLKGFENDGFKVNLYKKCGNVAPSVCRWVFDLIKN